MRFIFHTKCLRQLYVRYTLYTRYTDGNAPYVTGKTLESVITALEKVSNVVFKWFIDNLMQINGSKCHVLISTDKKCM